ncbi:MAG: type II toxin-antitoxin system RelE/ParE family toxin [Pontiellaceae bacterium]|nr:type II toxin-antitoxin system RelE/ParE family toxin [Pontiellaceae bacterium]
MNDAYKPLVWLQGEIKTPPFSKEARIEAGCLLRDLQEGLKLNLPHSRPMPIIGKRCHELRITDENSIWRIIYRIDPDAIVIAEVFKKKTQQTPKKVIEASKQRFKLYDSI